MFQRIRNRAQEEKGFTLIELLVVILIIGILAAIAIPTFLNQRGKAYDSSAKSQVKTAQIAEETWATDHNGAYTGGTGTAANLQGIEPTLSDTSSATLQDPTVPATGGGYTVTSKAANTGDTFSITVSGAGQTTRSCTTPSGASSNGCVYTAGVGSW